MRPAPTNPLAAHYTRFQVAERLLLTGHSHQAWPDVAREGVTEAFADAARYVDDKWERAFLKAERVRAGFRTLLGDPDAEPALAASARLGEEWLEIVRVPASPAESVRRIPGPALTVRVPIKRGIVRTGCIY